MLRNLLRFQLPSFDIGGDGENTGGGGAAGDTDQGKNGGGDADQNKGGDDSKITFTAEQEAAIAARIKEESDRVAGKVREEERKKAERKAEEDKKTADRKKAEEQGEFQKLYETEKTRADSLQSKAEAADQYAAKINDIIDSQIKSWPAEVKDTDPGSDDVDTRIKWLEKSTALAARLAALDTAPNGEFGKGGGDSSKEFKSVASDYGKKTYKRPDAR